MVGLVDGSVLRSDRQGLTRRSTLTALEKGPRTLSFTARPTVAGFAGSSGRTDQPKSHADLQPRPKLVSHLLPGPHAELREDLPQVVGDGVRADEELRADLGVGHPRPRVRRPDAPVV